jgi:tape measure domain-containing protein
MTANVGSISVLFEADLSRFQSQLSRGERMTSASAARMRGSVGTIDKAMVGLGRTARGTSLALAGLRAALPVAAGLALARQFLSVADAAQRMRNALRVAGLEGDALRSTQDALFKSAIRNAAPIESLTELFAKLKLAQSELGVSNEQLIRFTDSVAVGLRVSGKSASESAGALLQLSQALSAGTVRAEEFNSILEGAPAIAQAAAAGLTEAAGSVGKLRQLVIDGKISSQAFFAAIEAGSQTLRDKVAGSVFTVSDQMQNLRTAMIQAIGKFDEATGASSALARDIQRLAVEVNKLDFKKATKEMSEFEKGQRRLGESIRRWLGFSNSPNTETESGRSVAALERRIARLKEQVAVARDLGYETAELQRQLTAREDELTKFFRDAGPNDMSRWSPSLPEKQGTAKTVSLNDFAAPSSSTSASAAKVAAIDQEIAAIRERTDVLRFEASIMGATAQEASKLRIEHELVSAAMRDGKEITPELAAQISGLADQYAKAEIAAGALGDKQEEIADRNAELAAGFRSLAGDIVSGFREGKTAVDVLADALDNVASQLLNAGLNGLTSALFGGGSAVSPAIWQMIAGGMGGLFHGGGTVGSAGRRKHLTGAQIAMAPRFHSGLASDEFAAVLQRGEQVLTQKQTGVAMAALDKVASSGNRQAGTTINVDARYAQPGVGEEIRKALKEYDSQNYARTVAAVNRARKHRAL